MVDADVARSRWRARQKLTGIILLVWFVVTFVVAYFARSIDDALGHWPLAFWVGAVGAPLVYLGLVFWYQRSMNRLDQRSDGPAD